MNLDFTEVLRQLGPDAAFVIANRARAAGDYLFATLLPERTKPTYDVKAGNMTIRATMAGIVGMDSPFPPTGMVEATTFQEQTAKVANEVVLSEAARRDIRALLQTIGREEADATVQREVLNFLNKVVIQPHLDTREWMRAEALVMGKIDWRMNDKRLDVDYGIPAGHFVPTRNGVDAYDGAESKFWTDVRTARRLLRYNLRAIILHPETIDLILENPVNAVRVEAQEGSTFQLRRFTTVNAGAGEQAVLSQDRRDAVTLIGYDKEGEILDPANPGSTIKIPFMSRGKVLFVGQNTDTGYAVGEGATENPDNDLELGYTHLAPTEEGGGRMGMWADLTTPDDRPWQLRGRGVTNTLPVIRAEKKIVVATTAMPE